MVALVKRAKVPPDFLSSFYAFMFLPTEQPRYPYRPAEVLPNVRYLFPFVPFT